MKQYWDLKAEAGDALMLFRMGDFYELFGEDAVEAARILEITLTSRDRNSENPTAMAGVPFHSVQPYIQKLLKNGKKVAIAEQLSEPGGKGLVRREIIRTFTPAIQFEADSFDPCYLATAVRHDKGLWILSVLDSSTGEVRQSQPLEEKQVLEELAALPIKHFLHIESTSDWMSSRADVLQEKLPSNYLSQSQAEQCLKTQYHLDQLATFFQSPAQVRALGVLVTYATRSQGQKILEHLRLPRPLRKDKKLALSGRAVQHLDVEDLFVWINRTGSSLGSRQLKRWLLEPLCDPQEIVSRQAGVKEMANAFPARTDVLRTTMKNLYDLERISGRIAARLANPRDTYALGQSLGVLSQAAAQLQEFTSPEITSLKAQLDRWAVSLAPLRDRILKSQKDTPPFLNREGEIFNRGVSEELDRLITLTEDGQKWLVELEARERQATGINSLKVKYNRVFGYYIEITQTHLKNVPGHYQRKQTTVGAERFFTEELKKFEEDILTASEKRKALEQQLFEELVAVIREQTAGIMEAAQVLGETDAMLSLSRLAEQSGWAFPVIDDSLDLEIEAGRHPLVDVATRGAFVPNTLRLLPPGRSVMLITGPNMGGKSTIMRQVALIVILGQMGAAVPAAQARWGVFSSIHTRIGAHDAISQGQSTFMVEMIELAQILHQAGERSLLVLDEIGRGTSTYDGISVAWAALEWICKEIRARTLFATHYHELTRLQGELPGLVNAHMAVEEKAQKLRFLYELHDGPSEESFGIHVAQMAGLPKPVVKRAWQVLDQLEAQSIQSQGEDPAQMSLFARAMPIRDEEEDAPSEVFRSDSVLEKVRDEIRGVNVNEMTPVQALNFVARLAGELKENSTA